jgi:hypothetical protein
MGFTELGIGTGYIWAVNPAGTTILATWQNNWIGAQNARKLALMGRTIGLGQRGVGIIEIGTITDAGSISQVIIGAQNQIGSSVAYDVGEEEDVALALATAISVYTPGSGLNYFAQAIGNIVYIYPPQNATTAINGSAITVADTGDITITRTAISGVSGQDTVYNQSHGFRFYINSASDAPNNSIVGADEITKWIVPRTLDMSLPQEEVNLASDILTVDRRSSISFAVAGTQSSAASDDCVGITPVGFAENDLLYVRAIDETRVVNFIQDVNGNLILRNGVSYTSEGVGTYILFQFVNGQFWEVFRSGSNPNYIVTTYNMAASEIAAATLIPGCKYLISDRGDRGIVLDAETNNRFTLHGTYLAALPDYQNLTGQWLGRWTASLSPFPTQLTAWQERMYVNTTGANGASNPATDTTNWTALAFTDSRYVLESHACEFDFENDWVQKRADRRGNEVKINASAAGQLSGAPDLNNFYFFPWGYNIVFGNKLYNASWRTAGYTDGIITNNDFRNYSQLILNMVHSGSEFSNNKVDTAYPQLNLLNSGSRFINNTCQGCRINLDETAGSPIDVRNNVFKRIAQKDQIFSTNAISLEIKDYLRNCVIDSPLGDTFRPESGEDFDGRTFFGRESDFYSNISITGVTTIQAQGGFPAKNIGGELRLTSANASETVNVLNAAQVAIDYFTFKPGATLTALTIEGTLVANIVTGSIVIPQALWDDTSDSGSTFGGQLVLDGSQGDYCVVKRQTIGAVVCFVVEKVINNV